MFIIYWIMSAMFGIMASVDGSLYGVWFLCCLGCFILGLVNLLKGGYWLTILMAFVTIILSVIFIVDFLLIIALIITLWRFFKWQLKTTSKQLTKIS